jgi:hypothetical protein
MKQLATLALFLSITFVISSCSIPDLPGPIGIPGIEIQPTTASPE